MYRDSFQLGRRTKQPPCVPPHEWPERREGTRVLIESSYEDYRSEHAQVLRAAGYEVATCAGPSESHGCPLVEAGRCSLVDGADVVVSTTQLPDRERIIPRLTMRRRPAVVVEGPAPQLSRDLDLLGDAVLLPLPVSSTELLDAVAAASKEVAPG